MLAFIKRKRAPICESMQSVGGLGIEKRKTFCAINKSFADSSFSLLRAVNLLQTWNAAKAFNL